MARKRLRPSIFPGCAPYLNFLGPGEEYEDGMEPAEEMVLEFTVARGTGPVIIDFLNKFGFKINEWTTRHLSSVKTPVWDRLLVSDRDIKIDYRQAESGAKISSFPGTNSICRKDLLCRNYRKSQQKFGENCFDFLPETFNIPEEWNLLKKAMSRSKSAWIVKPPTGFAGKGIRLVSKTNQIGDIQSTMTVQKYVMNPFLIRGLKFDIRLYVLMTSIDPLKIYLYNDGLVRFATEPFSTKEEELGNKFIHITNTNLNKDNTVFSYSDDLDQFEGHKWSLKTLLRFLKMNGHDCSPLWHNIKRLVLKTILCGRKDMKTAFEDVKSDYNCFKLFGLDILLDEELKPWLLEVNNFPSFEPERLDRMVNEPLLAEMFNIVGFHITEPLDQQKENLIIQSQGLDNLFEFDSEMYKRDTTADQIDQDKIPGECRIEDSEVVKEANLTPRDVRTLVRSEEELSQTVNFSRLFTSQVLDKSDRECASCESDRDRLVDAWENVYGHDKEIGRELLARLCQAGVHKGDFVSLSASTPA